MWVCTFLIAFSCGILTHVSAFLYPICRSVTFSQTSNKWRFIPSKVLAATSDEANVDVAPKVYVPRKQQGSQSSGQNKVYDFKPKTKQDASRSGGASFEKKSNDNVLLLENPQLLIRFRIPKTKSSAKAEMEELQSFYQKQPEQFSRDGRSSGDATAKDPFFEKFSTPAVTSTDYSKGSKGKPAGKEDWRNRDSEGEFAKTKTYPSLSRRGNAGLDSDDLEENEYSDTEADDDYYGDEVTMGISSVATSTLQGMVSEGLSPEEIQMALYSEYGVKVSLYSLNSRLRDVNSARKNTKKTGKTRKDRVKSRNARFSSPVDDRIVLPTQGGIQVQELAALLDIGAGEVTKHLVFNMGLMVSMTQTIDLGIAREVIEAFGREVKEGDSNHKNTESSDEDANVTNVLHSRSPVVTIMGHVDHGKTSLLDRIRNSRVALGEAGGITQAISAFNVQTTGDRAVTFIDTPGHAAFSEMRVRGANVTDIVILVVAADDGIMDQTKECIAAAQAAGSPIVVAINKIDKEGADPQSIKTSLTNYGITVEEFGGDTQCIEVSAKQGIGIDELIEKVLLQAEVMNLRAPVEGPVQGTVLEARVDKGLGVVATVLVQKGTLSIGDLVVAGPSYGRIKRMLNDNGVTIQKAGPSIPVQVVGLNIVPGAGDSFSVCDSETDAKELADARMRINKQAFGSQSVAATLSQAAGFAEGNMDSREVIKIPILIKGDVSGTVEAIKSSLEAIEKSDDSAVCKIDIVYAGVGDVTSSDISIASIAKAKVIAFNVASQFNALEDARAANIDVGYYTIVYELLEELESKVEKTLAPPPPGKLVGTAEVRKIFKLGKSGKVAGCEVIDGIVQLNSRVRVMRGKRNPIFTGLISSLKIVKEDVAEVPKGSECGISIKDFAALEEGDTIECFVTSEK